MKILTGSCFKDTPEKIDKAVMFSRCNSTLSRAVASMRQTKAFSFFLIVGEGK